MAPRRGDTSRREDRPITAADLSRFWTKVDASGGPSACHPWTGAKNKKGYGQFRFNGQMRQAHRWILGWNRGSPLQWGTIKEEACHECDNPSCCNLAHLSVGTRKSNMQASLTRGRNHHANKSECPSGHKYEGENVGVLKSGERYCRECARLRAEKRRRLAGVKKQEKHSSPSCRHGHPYDEANTYWNRGNRFCRTCDRERCRTKRKES